MNDRPFHGVTIQWCEPLAEKHAFALAAQAWPEGERAGQWHAIRSALESGHQRRVVLLAARRQGELVAAVLGQVLPGRCAAVWAPQFVQEGEAQPQLAKVLLDQLATELAASGAALAQAILLTRDDLAAQRLRAAGFQHAGDLLYLIAPAENFPAEPPELPFQLQPFRPGEEARLARVIEQTYVGSLDCPQLDSLRQTADVIAGYKGVGQFLPNLWHFAVTAEGDVGCLLLNLHSDVGHTEIVYLGIVPEVRGRGFGRCLARQAQWLAGRQGSRGVVLAVDASNDPAISTYAATGFSECDRRSLWIRPLDAAANL